jgi:FkbM family methyltransferase
MQLYQLTRLYYRKFLKKDVHYLQKPIKNSFYSLKRLGSSYGGWFYVDQKSLVGSIFISCGLEEDVSFEIEFMKKYSATAFMVDPTPSSVIHINDILKNLGRKKTKLYTSNGKQPVESYDLRGLTLNTFIYVEKAISNKCQQVPFYLPQNLGDQSFSLIYKNTRNSYINVETTTIDGLLNENNLDIKRISLVKFDIEGSEIEAINHMLDSRIYPNQLLVEYDDLNNFENLNCKRLRLVESLHDRILLTGYKLVFCDGLSNFTYIRNIDYFERN